MEERITRDARELDPVWRQRFDADVASDLAAEGRLLGKAVALAVIVFLLVLVRAALL